MRTVFSALAVWIAFTGVAAAQMQGRVIMSGAERSNVLVRVEDMNGQVVDQAFTSVRGTFAVGVNSISANNPVYLVIEEEGYKPFRQLIRQVDLRGGLAALTIHLEPEDAPVTTLTGADGDVVSVRQLQVEIPAAAAREYEAALEDSARGNHEQAAERLEQVVELAPEYYDAWINLGRQYEQLARYEDAETAYREAHGVNYSADPRALLNLGALHYQQGERQRGEGDVAAIESYLLAEDWLRQAADLAPDSAGAHFYLGAVLYRLNLQQDAEQMLQNAMTLEPGHVDAQLMLINVYARQNRYDAALEQAVAFLETHPDAPQRPAIERVRAQLEDLLGR